jgi:periplasmic copper chaperone A
MQARAVALVTSFALALVVAACGSGGASAAPVVSGELTVSGAWVRAAQAGATSAAYLTLANGQAVHDALLGVSATDVTDSASIHETTSDGSGMTGMQHIDSIEIPSGGTVALEPGGFHIMLMGLKHDLKPGDRVTLVLALEQAGVVNVDAEVRAN